MNSKRRLVLALGVACLPLGGLRAQGRTWRVAWLNAGSIARQGSLFEAFREGLAELGYIEGRNIVIDMYAYSEVVESGGLVSYGVNVSQSFRRAPHYVDKILRGAQPATLPVEQAVKLEFVINLKTARTPGLVFPSAILVRADRVIE